MLHIRRSLLGFLFSGAHLLRWNDKLRPAELMEIDKQGHKMLTACALWLEHTAGSSPQERLKLGLEIIEGGLFDYCYRLVVTDIKPPVFYRIRSNPEHRRQLSDFVFRQLEPVLAPADPGFWERFRAWHADGDGSGTARRILEAAHRYASRWEFRTLRPLNTFDDEMEEIERNFQRELDALRDLPGVPALLDPASALSRFANICGQLRFQIRWTQVPRLPRTSVLGHMFMVAAYSYFYSLNLDVCSARRCNNFFCGLFHDLPEVLTRDIISPVKRSVASLPELIRDYEEQEMERRIFAPLRRDGFAALAERIGYYLGMDVGSEFQESTRTADGTVHRIDGFATLHTSCNADALDPKDGQLIKACDLLAAFMEAHSSIRNGVSSPQLQEAAGRLRAELAEYPEKAFQLPALMADFD